MRRVITYVAGVAVLLLLWGMMMAPRAVAGTGSDWYVATWGKDTNDCRSWATACRTIRAAYDKADAVGTIHIGPGVFRETNVLGNRVTLIGAGPNRTIIDGKKEHTVFTVFSEAFVTLRNMTIRNGKTDSPDWAGGIVNWGTLVLDHVIVEHNEGSEGGISSSGVLTMTNSAVVENVASYTTGGIRASGRVYLRNVTLARNRALTSGLAGALRVQGGTTADLVNVTISGNASTYGGGGIDNDGTLRLTNVTLANNTVSSPAHRMIDLYVDGMVTLRNTLILGECRGAGSVVSQGHNLEKGNTCGLTHSTDVTNTDPQLAALAHNGGLGETHALRQGSPAIDAGDDAVCPPTDQRGMGRWDGDGDGRRRCDIGAYEYVPSGVLQKRGYVPVVY
ncbi:MAG: hypothetical protein GXO55_09720 [Chloroflexi bacterium]|nr:hypothetical protein [Chloroflexota bacterium]